MADVRALGALSADVLATVSEIILAHDVTGWIANSKGTNVKFIYLVASRPTVLGVPDSTCPRHQKCL